MAAKAGAGKAKVPKAFTNPSGAGIRATRAAFRATAPKGAAKLIDT